MKKIKVAVVGASGYSGEELLNLLLGHPHAAVCCVTSRQSAGCLLGEVVPRLAGRDQGILFSDSNVDAVVESGAEVVFLALPHGVASEFALPLLKAGLTVIDLSADFRLRDAAVYKEFYGAEHPAPELLDEAIYGMPEIYRSQIRDSKLIASPGCYPTSIILPLVPLLKSNAIAREGILANSASGVSGAGRKAAVGFLFSECNENMKAYGLPKHRHLSEIEQELSLAAGGAVMIGFHPHLLPVTRGIHSTITCKLQCAPEEISGIYSAAYGDEPFIRILGEGGYPEIKHVARTNFLDIAWHVDTRIGSIVILSAEDNLTKGAAGQAVQSFNIVNDLPETIGLV